MPDARGASAADDAATERGAADRLAFFSDAVVAIAITLLALDLKVPQGETVAEMAASVAADRATYLAFLISFAVIARHWMSHHRLFRYVGRASTAVVWLNMAWLLAIVSTPFLTEVIADGNLRLANFGLYAVAQALQAGVFAVLVVVLAREGAFVEGTPESVRRNDWVTSVVFGAAFLVSVPLFPLMGPWTFVVWALVPNIAGRVLRRAGVLAPQPRGRRQPDGR